MIEFSNFFETLLFECKQPKMSACITNLYKQSIIFSRIPYFDRWMRQRMEHPRGVTLLAEDESGELLGTLVGYIFER